MALRHKKNDKISSDYPLKEGPSGICYLAYFAYFVLKVIPFT